MKPPKPRIVKPRLVRSCLIHIRDDAQFAEREALLAWGQDFLARAALRAKE